MNMYNSTQSYIRPAAKQSFRIPRPSQLLSGVVLDLNLLKRLGKVMAVIVPGVLLVQLSLSSSLSSMDGRLVEETKLQNQLTERNMVLRATRASLRSPSAVAERAAKDMSLYVAAPKQVGWFDWDKGQFLYK